MSKETENSDSEIDEESKMPLKKDEPDERTESMNAYCE